MLGVIRGYRYNFSKKKNKQCICYQFYRSGVKLMMAKPLLQGQKPVIWFLPSLQFSVGSLSAFSSTVLWLMPHGKWACGIARGHAPSFFWKRSWLMCSHISLSRLHIGKVFPEDFAEGKKTPSEHQANSWTSSSYRKPNHPDWRFAKGHTLASCQIL